MDLFKPSYFCLSKIASFLKKGDLLYFDESFDPDEFSLVHFFIKLNSGKYRILGISPCQILIEINSDSIIFPEYISQSS